MNVDSSSEQSRELLSLSLWEALVSSKLRRANAFSQFLSHLDHCRSAKQQQHVVVATPPATPSPSHPSLVQGTSLLPSDHWLLSQLGVGLLKLSERKGEWQSGFVVLHHLHRYGIHYVKLSQPPAPLPPLQPHPPSPCSVALTAVNICLHVEGETGSALEVMRGCEWVGPGGSGSGGEADAEGELRAEVLGVLAQRCLDGHLLEGMWECLEAVLTQQQKLAGRLVHLVTNLHNKLLQALLDGERHQFALLVYRAMRHAQLQCLPSVFGGLLQLLCTTDQVWHVGVVI